MGRTVGRLALATVVVAVGWSVVHCDSATADSRKWTVKHERDAMEDVTNVYLRLESYEPSRLWPPTPDLVIQCRRNKTNIVVVTYEPLRTQGSDARVRYRFDGAKPVSSSWTESTDFKAIFAPQPIALAKQLLKTSDWVFEYMTFSGNVVVARFRTSGLAEVLPLVSNACNWKVD
jgi:hypothetical protein